MRILRIRRRAFVNSLAVVFAFSFQSCQSFDDSTELPYVERLVVSGRLHKDGSANVFVERTLKFDEPYNREAAIVRDADVSIIHNSRMYRMGYRPEGRYVSTLPIPIAVGDLAELVVRWRSKEARAQTRMPSAPVIDEIGIDTTFSNGRNFRSFSTSFVPRPGECYFFAWEQWSGARSYGERPGELLTTQDAASDGKLHFRVDEIVTDPIDSLSFFVGSYDRPYYEFYLSRGYTEFVGLPVSFFSAPFRSNVTGDGTGLFVAQNYSLRTLRLR